MLCNKTHERPRERKDFRERFIHARKNQNSGERPSAEVLFALLWNEGEIEDEWRRARERFRLFLGILVQLHDGAKLLKLVWCRDEGDQWGAKAVLQKDESVISIIQNNRDGLQVEIEKINRIGYAMIQAPTNTTKVEGEQD